MQTDSHSAARMSFTVWPSPGNVWKNLRKMTGWRPFASRVSVVLTSYNAVHYLVQAGETSDAEVFIRLLAQHVPQRVDALMTIAQQLEQKGIEKEIQLGEQRGIREGRNEDKRENTRNMLQSGIDRITVLKMTSLSAEDLPQIHH